LHRLVSDPSFVIKTTAPVEQEDYRLLRVDFGIDPAFFGKQPKDPSRQIIGGSLLLEPEHDYTIHERVTFERRGDAPWTKAIVKYGKIQDGVRLPVRIETTLISDLEVCELENLELGTTPDSEFTLAAFGLPEPGSSGATARRRGPALSYQLGLAGLACLALAIGLRYWSKRISSHAADTV
jgi:hypothetical protein